MAELVYRQPCEHGYGPNACGDLLVQGELPLCPGGSEIVLDPDKVLFVTRTREQILRSLGKIHVALTVSDVLAALEETS